MRRFWCLIVAIVPAGLGCTTMSLERYTLSQIHTVDEFRINAALDCLAMSAANADNLPSFGIVINGTTHIQDMESIAATTLWTRAISGFASESLALGLSTSPQGGWTVDPVAEYSKLDAVRCACRWAVWGPKSVCPECGNLLEDPAVNYSPQEPQFGVADRLRRLPPDWVHIGRLQDVPFRACYKAHIQNTWIWIMPEDECILSEFILILHDIATIDLSAVYSPPLLVTITRTMPTKLPDGSAVNAAAPNPAAPNPLNPLTPPLPPPPQTAKGTAFVFSEYRVVRPERRKEIEDKIKDGMRSGQKVDISWQQWLEYTYAYSGTRTNTKAAGGPQPNGGSGAILQQQNLTPPTRNPALLSDRLGLPSPSAEDYTALRRILDKFNGPSAPK